MFLRRPLQILDTDLEPVSALPDLKRSPHLPLELERIVFDLAAFEDWTEIPRLMRIAWRVKQCVAMDPGMANPDLAEVPQISTANMLRFISRKSNSFLAASVRHLFINIDFGDRPCLLQILILNACPKLTDLYLYDIPTSSNHLPLLCRLKWLSHLAIRVSDLFPRRFANFGSPLFRNVTHLQLLDHHSTLPVLLGQSLSHAPCLSHVAFSFFTDVLGVHDSVRVNTRLCCIAFLSSSLKFPNFPASLRPIHGDDDRFVCISDWCRVSQWFRGATNRLDYWTLADSFIAAKRAGKADASQYLISASSATWSS
ncbi:hypothetical protein R3P38DRAFT_3303323 [Favolaschia claudopus]|uniref:F-box protein n=1 Tax=Favolaschia claudopus TaxID=2862362 RepID=A0AAW0EG65_9AGAR